MEIAASTLGVDYRKPPVVRAPDCETLLDLRELIEATESLRSGKLNERGLLGDGEDTVREHLVQPYLQPFSRIDLHWPSFSSPQQPAETAAGPFRSGRLERVWARRQLLLDS